MNDFILAAENELASIGLAKMQLEMKEIQLRLLISLYKADPTYVPPMRSQFAPSLEPKKINRPINKDREHALSLAAEAIKGRRAPTRTAEIYEIIEPLGAKIGGAEPKSNLSAMLHHSPLFRSHGRRGWTLAEENIVLEGDDDGDDEGTALDFSEPTTEDDDSIA
jgi:hypothetical protein